MNIDELTIGQAKELAAFFNGAPKGSESVEAKSLLGKNMVGQYVICRSRNEGINAGFVVEMDDTGIVLSDCRRIWYHKPKDKSLAWYEGVAISGVSDDSKLSAPVTKVIIEDYSLTVCTECARESIQSAEYHGQN